MKNVNTAADKINLLLFTNTTPHERRNWGYDPKNSNGDISYVGVVTSALVSAISTTMKVPKSTLLL
jgi:hypothetical protein